MGGCIWNQKISSFCITLQRNNQLDWEVCSLTDQKMHSNSTVHMNIYSSTQDLKLQCNYRNIKRRQHSCNEMWKYHIIIFFIYLLWDLLEHIISKKPTQKSHLCNFPVLMMGYFHIALQWEQRASGAELHINTHLLSFENSQAGHMTKIEKKNSLHFFIWNFFFCLPFPSLSFEEWIIIIHAVAR